MSSDGQENGVIIRAPSFAKRVGLAVQSDVKDTRVQPGAAVPCGEGRLFCRNALNVARQHSVVAALARGTTVNHDGVEEEGLFSLSKPYSAALLRGHRRCIPGTQDRVCEGHAAERIRSLPDRSVAS